MSCGWCGHGCRHYGYCYRCGHGYDPPPFWPGCGPGCGPWRCGRRALDEEDLVAYLEDLEDEIDRLQEELARVRRPGRPEEADW